MWTVKRKKVLAPFFLPIVSIFFFIFFPIIPRMVLLGTKTCIIAAKREAGNGSPVSFFDCTSSQHECEGISWFAYHNRAVFAGNRRRRRRLRWSIRFVFHVVRGRMKFQHVCSANTHSGGGGGRRNKIKNHTRKKWYDIKNEEKTGVRVDGSVDLAFVKGFNPSPVGIRWLYVALSIQHHAPATLPHIVTTITSEKKEIGRLFRTRTNAAQIWAKNEAKNEATTRWAWSRSTAWSAQVKAAMKGMDWSVIKWPMLCLPTVREDPFFALLALSPVGIVVTEGKSGLLGLSEEFFLSFGLKCDSIPLT